MPARDRRRAIRIAALTVWTGTALAAASGLASAQPVSGEWPGLDIFSRPRPVVVAVPAYAYAPPAGGLSGLDVLNAPRRPVPPPGYVAAPRPPSAGEWPGLDVLYPPVRFVGY